MYFEIAWRVGARRSEEAYRVYGDTGGFPGETDAELQRRIGTPGDLPKGASVRSLAFVGAA